MFRSVWIVILKLVDAFDRVPTDKDEKVAWQIVRFRIAGFIAAIFVLIVTLIRDMVPIVEHQREEAVRARRLFEAQVQEEHQEEQRLDREVRSAKVTVNSRLGERDAAAIRK